RHTRWPRDWSSDVCSSDLDSPTGRETTARRETPAPPTRGSLPEHARPACHGTLLGIVRRRLRSRRAPDDAKTHRQAFHFVCEKRSEERRVGKERTIRWCPD